VKTRRGYQKIVQLLQKQRMGLAEPFKLAAEAELAEQYGVARTTVRRAMQVLEDQGAVTRRRGRGTFLHPQRPQLASLEGSVVGFIPPWWADSIDAYYTSMVFNGVCASAEKSNANISVLKVDQLANDAHQLLRQIDKRGIDGLVWVHPVPEQAEFLAEVSRHMPCVAIGRAYPNVGLNTVTPDYAQAARLIDAHLVAHRRPCYSVVGRSTTDPLMGDFIRGFADAHRRRHERFDITRFVDIGPFNRDKIADLLLDFHLDQRRDSSALVLTTSSYLGPLLTSERFKQVVSSGELAVMAFDYGVRHISEYWPGRRIDHVACDWQLVGAQAMQMLASLIRREDDVPRVVRTNVELVAGQTVTALAGERLS
jgi:DNA-binding LacI/PurR family transcriptional regulator